MSDAPKIITQDRSFDPSFTVFTFPLRKLKLVLRGKQLPSFYRRILRARRNLNLLFFKTEKNNHHEEQDFSNNPPSCEIKKKL